MVPLEHASSKSPVKPAFKYIQLHPKREELKRLRSSSPISPVCVSVLQRANRFRHTHTLIRIGSDLKLATQHDGVQYTSITQSLLLECYDRSFNRRSILLNKEGSMHYCIVSKRDSLVITGCHNQRDTIHTSMERFIPLPSARITGTDLALSHIWNITP